MILEKYKDALSEYEKFWNRENTARPILNISYKKEGFVPYRLPVSMEERFFDATYRYNKFKHTVANSGYLAEGIPMYFTNYGPGCLAAAIGGNFLLTDRAIWFDTKHIIEDWENPPIVVFNEESVLWQRVKAMQRLCASDPDVHFSVTDIGGILDIVASLRGTENLLCDLYDYPEEVKEFTEKVKVEWFKAFDQQVKTIQDAGQPYNNWMNVPSAKPWYPLQCDFCYMIKPAHFEEFVLPHLIEQVNYMERSIYHLDGVGELPHVDMLLDIPNLTGIQWVSGTGNALESDKKWFDLYRKIQDKKKNLIILADALVNDMKGLESLIKTLDPTGVYLQFNCSSKAVAEDLLEKITVWSR